MKRTGSCRELRKKIFSVYFIIAFIGFYLPHIESVSVEAERLSWPEIVTFAKANLPQEGVLKVGRDGYIYLKVDDDYIHRLYPLLQLRNFREPPFFRNAKSPGAHISVIYKNENVIPDEAGKTFHFTLNKIVIVNPSREVSYVILQVDSQELESLREKYGLPPKLHGHKFHITLAKKEHRRF